MIDHSNWWMFIFSCCSPINIIAYKKSIMQPQGLVYIDWNKYLKNKLYQMKHEKILKLQCGVAWANCNVVYEDLSFLAQIELESWTEIAGKFMKLSEIGFSLKCFTIDFWQFSIATVKTHFLGDRLGTHHQFQVFQRFSWNVLIS